MSNMRITNVKNSLPFGRNKYLRKGDEIQRRTKNELAIFSPLYASIYYKTPNNTEDTEKFNRANSILINKGKEVQMNREMVRSVWLNNPIKNYFNLKLQNLKFTKIGNCEEMSIAALCTLLLNGFTDAERKGLYLKSEFINKETGEVEYVKKNTLDHVFVTSALGKDVKSEDEKFVIDPWLGFCDTVAGAKCRYKDLSKKRQIYHELIFDHSFYFRNYKIRTDERMPKEGEYEQRVSLCFEPYDHDLNKSVDKIVDFASTDLPNLKLP